MARSGGASQLARGRLLVVGPAELKALEVIIDSAGRGEPICSYAELAAAVGLTGRSRVSALIANLEAGG